MCAKFLKFKILSGLGIALIMTLVCILPASAASMEETSEITETFALAAAGWLSTYHLAGFSAGNNGGGIVDESNTTLYKKVHNVTDLAAALKKGSGVKVVEIMNDRSLGWNELPSAAMNSPFSAHNSPLTHPVLLQTGVSKIGLDGVRRADDLFG